MCNKAFLFSFFLALLFISPALAQPFFVGGSVGNGFNNKNLGDLDGNDFKIKKSNLAWKVFASTQWRFLGAEGGYRDFGEIDNSTDRGSGTSRTRGGDAFAKGMVSIGVLQIFAKAGAFFSRTKTKLVNEGGQVVIDDKERETAFAWGLGGGLQLGRLQIRAEYENFHISEGNLGMLSIGAAIGLGRRERE